MIVGIDLGTTNSLVAYYADDGPYVIPNRIGKRLTPSVVSIGEDGQVYVGESAAEQMLGSVVSGNLAGLLEGNDALLALGRERQKDFCLYLEDLLRKMMMRHRGLNTISDVLPQEEETVTRLSPLIPDGFYEKAFKALEEARTMIEANVNAKMVFCHLANVLFATKNF